MCIRLLLESEEQDDDDNDVDSLFIRHDLTMLPFDDDDSDDGDGEEEDSSTDSSSDLSVDGMDSLVLLLVMVTVRGSVKSFEIPFPSASFDEAMEVMLMTGSGASLLE